MVSMKPVTSLTPFCGLSKVVAIFGRRVGMTRGWHEHIDHSVQRMMLVVAKTIGVETRGTKQVRLHQPGALARSRGSVRILFAEKVVTKLATGTCPPTVDHPPRDVTLSRLRDSPRREATEQCHQGGHFDSRTLPVLL